MTDDPTFDEVQKARHYNSHPSEVQAIEVGRHLTADWFNAFKYVFRADHKNGRQDIEKALWYAKDGVAHRFPVQSPTWNNHVAEKLKRIINFEAGWRRAFFVAVLHDNLFEAGVCIQQILEEWPDA